MHYGPSWDASAAMSATRFYETRRLRPTRTQCAKRSSLELGLQSRTRAVTAAGASLARERPRGVHARVLARLAKAEAAHVRAARREEAADGLLAKERLEAEATVAAALREATQRAAAARHEAEGKLDRERAAVRGQMAATAQQAEAHVAAMRHEAREAFAELAHVRAALAAASAAG